MMALVACQPQVLEVEVTRLVESTAVSTRIPAPAASAETILVEVTRLASVEVTRIVPEEIIIEVTQSPLGSVERPVQLLFAPIVDTAVLPQRTQSLVDVLEDVTGRQVEVGILNDEQSVIDLMCAAPADTIGFLSATGFVQAQEQCGAEATAVGLNETGQAWQAGMIVVRNGRDITTLADLDGKIWAVPDETSIPSFLYFQALLNAANVTPAEIRVVPGDTTAMLAVLNGEADFASGRFIPPVLPYAEREWVYGEDDPEMWREANVLPGRSGIGYIIVRGGPDNGGYRVRDARSGIYDTNRTIFRDTEILTISAPIPNETIAFGADFPVGLARQVTAVLLDFGSSETCRSSICATDMFGWSGLTTAVTADYDPLRFVEEVLDLEYVEE